MPFEKLIGTTGTGTDFLISFLLKSLFLGSYDISTIPVVSKECGFFFSKKQNLGVFHMVKTPKFHFSS